MSGRLAAWEPLSAWLVYDVCVWCLVSAIHHGWLGGRGNTAATFYHVLNGVCFLRHVRAWKLIASVPGMRQGRCRSAD